MFTIFGTKQIELEFRIIAWRGLFFKFSFGIDSYNCISEYACAQCWNCDAIGHLSMVGFVYSHYKIYYVVWIT
jgi:hypothetical protein